MLSTCRVHELELDKEKDPEKKKKIRETLTGHRNDGCDVRDFWNHAFQEARTQRFGLETAEEIEDAELALESKLFYNILSG